VGAAIGGKSAYVGTAHQALKAFPGLCAEHTRLPPRRRAQRCRPLQALIPGARETAPLVLARMLDPCGCVPMVTLPADMSFCASRDRSSHDRLTFGLRGSRLGPGS
jgi:hypothetical protein